MNKISTPLRYLYLNSYAILLFLLGMACAFIPCYKVSWLLVAVQVVAVILFLRGAAIIFSSWNDKKRKYAVLMERNSSGIRHETFSEYVQAPCGRLLIRIVLKDLGLQSEYRNIMKLKKPLLVNLKESCTPRKTRIYINKDF